MNTTNYHVLGIIALILWMIGLGLWVERNRFGGTLDLVDQRDELRKQNDELTMTVDYLVEENARLRGEVTTRRQASMRSHPASDAAPRLHLVAGGGR